MMQGIGLVLNRSFWVLTACQAVGATCVGMPNLCMRWLLTAIGLLHA